MIEFLSLEDFEKLRRKGNLCLDERADVLKFVESDKPCAAIVDTEEDFTPRFTSRVGRYKKAVVLEDLTKKVAVCTRSQRIFLVRKDV